MIRDGDRVADVAAGERLAQHEDVRKHEIRDEAMPRPSEAGGHLIED